MKRSLVLFLAVALTLSFAAVALAGEYYHDKRRGHGIYPHMLKKLNLTPAQQKKFAGLEVAYKKVAAPARAQIEVKLAELRTLWMAEKPSRRDLLDKKAEIYAEKKKIFAAKVDLKLGLLKILTKEQKKTFWAMKGKSKSKSKSHRGCDCPGHKPGHGQPPCKYHR